MPPRMLDVQRANELVSTPALGGQRASLDIPKTPGRSKKSDLPGLINSYGDGTRTGQLGAAAPLLSAQLMRPLGAARTNGATGELAVM